MMYDREMLFDILKLRNFPESGSVVCLMASVPDESLYPYDEKKQVRVKTYFASVICRRNAPGRCQFTLFNNMDYGIPSFVANQFMARAWPSIASKAEVEYKKRFAEQYES